MQNSNRQSRPIMIYYIEVIRQEQQHKTTDRQKNEEKTNESGRIRFSRITNMSHLATLLINMGAKQVCMKKEILCIVVCMLSTDITYINTS